MQHHPPKAVTQQQQGWRCQNWCWSLW